MSKLGAAIEQRDKARESAPTIHSYLEALKPEIQRSLPRGMDADRIARLALTVVRKDRQLQQCSPASFAGALLTAASLGLEPGVNGEAYLVAYKGECTLIVGFQGYAKLFWQHPLARHLDAQAVHEHDEFDYAYGLEPTLTHKPALGDRGKVVAYYAVAVLATGAKAFVVLTPEEVRALRGGKSGSNGGIADPQHWMERKTALRQLFKLLPKSTTLAQAIEADERVGSDLTANGLMPPPANVDELTGVIDGEVEPETGWPETATPGGEQ